MELSTWLTILAVVVGSATSPSTEYSTTYCPPGRVCRIGSNCWINGVYHTPCPDDAPPDGGGGDTDPITNPPL